MEHAGILVQSTVFRGIEPSRLEELLDGALYQLRSFEPSDMVAQAGSPCNHIRVILEGNVRGEMMDISGKVLKIEDIESPGMIAPAFLFGSQRLYPVNVLANTKVLLWQMHRDDFSRLLQKDFQTLNNYLNSISGRAQFLSEKLKFVSFSSIRAKIAGFILHYSGGESIVRLPITHQQMSEVFGVTRPSLSREIRKMNLDGIIRSRRDEIEILNREELKNLVKSD